MTRACFSCTVSTQGICPRLIRHCPPPNLQSTEILSVPGHTVLSSTFKFSPRSVPEILTLELGQKVEEPRPCILST